MGGSGMENVAALHLGGELGGGAGELRVGGWVLHCMAMGVLSARGDK